MQKNITQSKIVTIQRMTIGAIIIIIAMFFILKPVTLDKTDTISVQTLVDTQEGVISQDEQIILSDKVKTKTEYLTHVRYSIIDKETTGKTLFTTQKKASDNLAYVAGDILETTVSCYPTKTRVNVHLSMISSATPITNKNGEPIDITKQQLVPIITIKQVAD